MGRLNRRSVSNAPGKHGRLCRCGCLPFDVCLEPASYPVRVFRRGIGASRDEMGHPSPSPPRKGEGEPIASGARVENGKENMSDGNPTADDGAEPRSLWGASDRVDKGARAPGAGSDPGSWNGRTGPTYIL